MPFIMNILSLMLFCFNQRSSQKHLDISHSDWQQNDFISFVKMLFFIFPHEKIIN